MKYYAIEGDGYRPPKPTEFGHKIILKIKEYIESRTIFDITRKDKVHLTELLLAIKALI
jgi:hypothetical protein